jgi:hypothetical protein
MVELIFSDSTMSALRDLELRFMDKLCKILRQPEDSSGLQRGAVQEIAACVPCSVAIS